MLIEIKITHGLNRISRSYDIDDLELREANVAMKVLVKEKLHTLANDLTEKLFEKV